MFAGKKRRCRNGLGSSRPGGKTRTESAIADKLSYRDIQMWRGSGVIGLVKDKNINAYQCLSLGNKIMVLETVVAEHFDSKLQHVAYKGPT